MNACTLRPKAKLNSCFIKNSLLTFFFLVIGCATSASAVLGEYSY